jgi:hypothetical protein
MGHQPETSLATLSSAIGQQAEKMIKQCVETDFVRARWSALERRLNLDHDLIAWASVQTKRCAPNRLPGSGGKESFETRSGVDLGGF